MGVVVALCHIGGTKGRRCSFFSVPASHPRGVCTDVRPLRDEDPRTIGGYDLLECLGEGGMGRVYVATSRGTGTPEPVVIKVVRTEWALDPTFRERFRREVALARRVRGRFLAEIFDADPEASPPWLAMEYIQGPTLAEHVDSGGPLDVPGLQRLAWGLGHALAIIHDQGIVHRDIKPANVMMAQEEPRLIDFGLAKAARDSTGVSRGQVVGTPSYMSPEQVRGGPVTAASDVFALGGVLYFAATGAPPFGERDDAVFHRIHEMEPDLGRVPLALRELVADCLSKDPRRRPDPETIACGLDRFFPQETLPPRVPPRRTSRPDHPDVLSLHRLLRGQGHPRPQEGALLELAVECQRHTATPLDEYMELFRWYHGRSLGQNDPFHPGEEALDEEALLVVAAMVGIACADRTLPHGLARQVLSVAASQGAAAVPVIGLSALWTRAWTRQDVLRAVGLLIQMGLLKGEPNPRAGLLGGLVTVPAPVRTALGRPAE